MFFCPMKRSISVDEMIQIDDKHFDWHEFVVKDILGPLRLPLFSELAALSWSQTATK